MYLGGKATFGPNRSQELADEMSDVWERIMTYSFACPTANAAFLFFEPPPANRVDDSTVTSAIIPDIVSAALKEAQM